MHVCVAYKMMLNTSGSAMEEIVLKYPYHGDPWPVFVELWERSTTQESV